MNTKVTKTFKAVDSFGNEVLILQKTEYHDAATFGNPDAEPEAGLSYYTTSNGLKVEEISKTEFQVIGTDEVLKVKP